LRLGHDAVADALIQRARDHAGQERAGVLGLESCEMELQKARELRLGRGIPDGEDDPASGAARSRRATNPSTCRVAPSSHWASSTTQSTGPPSAAEDSTPKAASATTRRKPDARRVR
jgi:hypothetical protein